MSLVIRSLAFILLMMILLSNFASGKDVTGMAIIANKPSALGIGPVAPGHLAFAFQDPLDGLFFFGSVGLDFTYSGVLIDPKTVDINKKYTFEQLKNNLSKDGYESYKVFYVTNPDVNAAIDAENELTTANYNLFASTTKPITDPLSHALGADDENCLTATKKVLEEYGLDLPDTDNPSLLTSISLSSLPNVYYSDLAGQEYDPDSTGDDPSVPTGYKKDAVAQQPLTKPIDPQTTAAADALLIGNPQSPVTWLETSPIDSSQSDIQEPTQPTIKPDTNKFSEGDRIEVTDSLNVRDSPGLSSGTVTSTKAAGSTATVLSGPYFKDDFTWWEVRYDDGTTGYSQEKRLELAKTSVSSPTSVSSSSKSELESNSKEPVQRYSNAKFSKGDRIEVTNSLNVRDAPGLSSGTVISTKAAGSTATVLSGPYYRDDFTWWEVRYEDGTTGYSQEKRLELAQTSASSQTPAVQPVDPLTVTEPIDQPDDFAFGDNQQIEDSAYINQIPSSDSESIHRDSSGGPLTGQVQLELSLRNENGNPAPAGTKVLIEDGSGNYVKANLDSNGYALIYGDPGTWTITADAPGYATNTGHTSVSSESSHSSFRMNLQKGGTNDQDPSVNSPISPQSSAFPAEQPASSAATKVSLEIDLRNENGNAVPAGTKVTVRDGSGNIVPTNWDSNGHTIAYGDPGTWTITAEAPGYATNMYYAAVSSSSSSTSTRIYLQKNGYIDQPPQQSSPSINSASQSANQQSSQQSTNGQSVSQTQDEKLSKTQKDAILIDLLESRTKGKDLSADEVDALMNDLDELGRQLDQQSAEPSADDGPAFGDSGDNGPAFGENLHEGTAFGM